MLSLRIYNKFKKDYKKAVSRGLDPSKLEEVIRLLREEKELPQKYRDHKLKDDRNYRNMRECHIQPDWLLIYHISKDELVLALVRTGTHRDLLNIE